MGVLVGGQKGPRPGRERRRQRNGGCVPLLPLAMLGVARRLGPLLALQLLQRERVRGAVRQAVAQRAHRAVAAVDATGVRVDAMGVDQAVVDARIRDGGLGRRLRVCLWVQPLVGGVDDRGVGGGPSVGPSAVPFGAEGGVRGSRGRPRE
eukprot:1191610-Prorocentrum_minimum.AAC.1